MAERWQRRGNHGMWWAGDDRELQKDVVLVHKEQLDLVENEVSAFPFLLCRKSSFSGGDMEWFLNVGFRTEKSYW